jgi:hypothetical protein
MVLLEIVFCDCENSTVQKKMFTLFRDLKLYYWWALNS